jgi:hypothetical protein
MTVTALEISLNGKVLYTAGMEDWMSLGANIHGHRLSKESLEEMSERSRKVDPAWEPPAEETLHLSCYVGVPEPDRPNQAKGQSYGFETLSVGDEITVRIIKTDKLDKPPKPPSAKEGQTLLYADVTGLDRPK